jgi:hypothetical protein
MYKYNTRPKSDAAEVTAPGIGSSAAITRINGTLLTTPALHPVLAGHVIR